MKRKKIKISSAAVVISTLQVNYRNDGEWLFLTFTVENFKLTHVMLNKFDAMSISNFQPIRLLDPDCWYKFTNLMTNSADPDQLASSEANWSGSTLFAKTGHVVFSKRRVKLYL